MKPLLLILALAFTIQAQSAKEGKRITKWTPVDQGADERVKSYFAPETVRRADDVIKVWVKFEFPYGSGFLPQNTDFGMVRAYVTLDCAQSRISLPTAITYDRNGKFVAEKERINEAVDWEKPNTMGHAIFEYFCERPAPPPTKAPTLKPN
jgi:hypothetical protein